VRRLVVLLVALAALLGPQAAGAHPLGNFTVNRYSAVELSGDRVYVRYALDLAEIPTFQEGDRVRAPGFAAELGRGLVLEVDGRRVSLVPVEHKLVARPGAGGLETLRFDGVYEARGRVVGTRLVFHDTNFASRAGWKEVVVLARDGARVVSSSVPARSASDELRAYPRDLLQAPLDVSSAEVRYEPGTDAGSPPELRSAAAPKREDGGFEALVAAEELGLGVVLVSLLAATFWGAAHALTPGHGKAIVAGYLVGSRGRPRHAVLLGLIVTVTHTAGVFALGLVTLMLSRFVVPERLYPWLTLASGLLVVGVGAGVLASRFRHMRSHKHHGHSHRHSHKLDHDHELGTRGLLGVGVAAGLLPCPSALVVLLSAIALNRIGLGLALILAFSVGLAATITAIGLMAVLARRAFSRVSLNGHLVRALPAVSALVILAVGIGITVDALPEVL
jgi:ABC-type nickel/cobalt efflux system permease component RcnA